MDRPPLSLRAALPILAGSWFYADDYRLIGDARAGGLTLEQLGDPFDSQFMPLGRLIAWVVADSGYVNWPVAAGSILLLQAIASFACLLMLVVLFGDRKSTRLNSSHSCAPRMQS